MTQQQQQKQNSASLAKWARIKIISKVKVSFVSHCLKNTNLTVFLWVNFNFLLG